MGMMERFFLKKLIDGNVEEGLMRYIRLRLLSFYARYFALEVAEAS